MFFMWNIQLVKNYGGFFCTYKDFLSPTWLICSSFEFRSYYGRSDDFELDEPWKIWQLICMAPNQKNESGTKCWLTGLIRLSLKQFYLTEENLKMFYNLKVIPMKALEARSDIGHFGSIQS